ncbi:MAG: hypothetical protein LCH30_06205 [Proteobacteria bacterium]|nr:hypothetical protein [Pseudomonadota bacterium]
MKLRALLFTLCFAIFSTSFATNSHHTHPKANTADSKKAVKMAGYCEVEIVNRSYDDVTVYGRFDDGSPLQPFNIYAREIPHYIDLYYYGYCHSGISLYIESFGHYSVFEGYVPAGSTVEIVPFFGSKMKVEIHAK